MRLGERTIPITWLVVVVWIALVLANVGLQRVTGTTTSPCLFRHATDLPCPTCGGTRAALSLADGQPIQAFANNPLLTIAMPVVPLWLLSRRTRPESANSIPTGVLAALLGLVLLNWVYLLLRAT